MVAFALAIMVDTEHSPQLLNATLGLIYISNLVRLASVQLSATHTVVHAIALPGLRLSGLSFG